MADYKEKIRSLLALAQSPEEAEAKAALLKARKLMAEHKLTEADVEEVKNQAVRNVLTDITSSKRRDPWIVRLSSIIGTHYCCQGYRKHLHGKQTQYIGFIGLEDDVEICMAIFKYAVDCIKVGIKIIKKENAGYCPEYIKQQCDSYGYGFTNGIRAALEAQDEAHRGEWGLVLVMPQEVQAAAQYLGKHPFRARTERNIDPEVYSQGYEQGKKFDPSRRLDEGAARSIGLPSN